MGRSLMEHLAAAPPNVQLAVRLAVALAVASPADRERALAKLPPELAAGIRDELPPWPPSKADVVAVFAATLGPDHGGTEWLAGVRGRLWHLPEEQS